MKLHMKQIISGITLFILGGIIIPTVFCIIAFTYVLTNKPLAKFIIPGQVTVTITNQGRYYLWNDHQTIFDGKTYSSPEELPAGLDISLLEKQNGGAVRFIPDPSITSSNNNSHKISVGYFEVNESGAYVLSILGKSEPRVCSFGKSTLTLRTVLIFLGTSCVSGVMGITGFVLVLIGIINLIKDKNQKTSLDPVVS